jgi:hypothetical protein
MSFGFNMRDIFHDALKILEDAFRRLEIQVPPPKRKALILKLARTISGLHAIDVLLLHGHLQEQASLHRILDEIHEDIFFLVAGITNDEMTERHKQYLEAFWAEEFPDPENTLARHKKPNLPPRKKIRAYVHGVLGGDHPNPSLVSDLGENISSTYSGYVHASAPQVMDMYGGNPPRFHISGMQGTPRMHEYIADAWNYFYRGLLSVVAIGKAVGDAELVDEVKKYIEHFKDASGAGTNL